MKPWKTKDTIEDNPIGLPKDVTSMLIPELDRHQASLFVLFHQYQKHHWLVEGPQFRDLHHFLQESYEAVHKQVDMIAERMTALGGIPTSHPAELVKVSYVEHEPEGGSVSTREAGGPVSLQARSLCDCTAPAQGEAGVL